MVGQYDLSNHRAEEVPIPAPVKSMAVVFFFDIRLTCTKIQNVHGNPPTNTLQIRSRW